MTNFWSGGMRENEKKCHQGSLLCCIWQCLWATLSVSQKSWATAAIREDRHFQSRFLGGGWEEGQRERRREWGEKRGEDGDEGRAHPVQPWHHSPALVYIQGMARASFRVHSLSKPAEGKRKPGGSAPSVSLCLDLLVRRLKDDGRTEHPAGLPDASGFQLLESLLR